MSALPDTESSRVVLVGSSSYGHLPSLPAVAANVQALKSCLTNRSLWGIAPNNVYVVNNPVSFEDLLDPTNYASETAIDTLIFYYSGHGLVDSNSNLQLALHGSIEGRIHTATPYDWIRSALVNSRARRRIVILDCCYSGRALGSMSSPATDVAGEAEIEGTFLLAAVAENKRALSPPGETYSAFTGELVSLLQRGDPKGPEFWDLNTLYSYVRSALRAKSRPQPQKRDRNSVGDLPLIRNSAWKARKVDHEPTHRWPQRESDASDVSAAQRDVGFQPRLQTPATSAHYIETLTADDVRNVTFSTQRTGARGYEEEDVDNFLDQIEAKLRNPTHITLTADDVRNVTFNGVPPGKRGYDEDQVDKFLDRVELQLRILEQ